MTATLVAGGMRTATVNGYAGEIGFSRVGNVVMCSVNTFRSTSSSVANGATLSQTVPYGYRPVRTAYVPEITNTASNRRFAFTPSGGIAYYGSSAWSSGNTWGTGMWFTNDA